VAVNLRIAVTSLVALLDELNAAASDADLLGISTALRLWPSAAFGALTPR